MSDRSNGTIYTAPTRSEIPSPSQLGDSPQADGYVVWHRTHLRIEDHRAFTEAVSDSDVVCPLFVFDPTFYGGDGLACDARLRFFHEAITSLDRLYAAAPAKANITAAPESRSRIENTTQLELPASGRFESERVASDTLSPADTVGMTFGFGDPAALLSRFVERDWKVLTMATPTSRYGLRRDRRVKECCGDEIEFVSGDGLVRGRDWPRKEWQDEVESWLTAAQYEPGWNDHETTRLAINTGLTPAAIDDAFDVEPTKTKVPTGTHHAATTQLREFAERIHSYPGSISAPQDARGGTSGLSPYINFGLLSVRQIYQHIIDTVPESRGRSMFISRLFWNLHYNQKLVDWPGWTKEAVNPVFAGFNEDNHSSALVAAWKQGKTGYPMVDASMRCLRDTGWLNFRMRAMCASFFTHILQQPWWIGADWYHHHLIDSDVGINYTQWQSQAGLIGKPSQLVYNPRKQVRDHDPDGEWITEWVPELSELPGEFLPRPERTPLAVQNDCGVSIGEDYPRPVVEFEARREEYWDRFERYRPNAAAMLRRPAIAKRASFSGGYSAARAIADEYGSEQEMNSGGTQLSLGDIETDQEGHPPSPAAENGGQSQSIESDIGAEGDSSEPEILPTGVGQQAGEPSPDDRAAVVTASEKADASDEQTGEPSTASENSSEDDQTTLGQFNSS